jgi:hypothetical protein
MEPSQGRPESACNLVVTGGPTPPTRPTFGADYPSRQTSWKRPKLKID